MGAMAAVVSKKNENVIPKVALMLPKLMHRGADAHGIASPNQVIVTKSIKELKGKRIVSNTALGHNLSRILQRDCPQPVQGEGFSLVFEGRLFPPSVGPDANEFLTGLGSDLMKSVERDAKELDGSFVFAVALPGRGRVEATSPNRILKTTTELIFTWKVNLRGLC